MDIAYLSAQVGRRHIELFNYCVHFTFFVTLLNEEDNEGPFVVDGPVPQALNSTMQHIFHLA
jgi:hypothetical protein